MKLGWLSGSLGSGGMRTKWRISAAEVPIYKFSSGLKCQHWRRSEMRRQRTPELDAGNADILVIAVGGERYVGEQLAQGVGAGLDVAAGARAGGARGSLHGARALQLPSLGRTRGHGADGVVVLGTGGAAGAVQVPGRSAVLELRGPRTMTPRPFHLLWTCKTRAPPTD